MHLARTKVAKSKVRPSMPDGAGTDTLDLRVLYGVLADEAADRSSARAKADAPRARPAIAEPLAEKITKSIPIPPCNSDQEAPPWPAPSTRRST